GGLLVLPGGVDPHVHIQMPAGATSTCDTWASSTRAAAFGGTTTVIDFVEPSFPGQLLLQSFHSRLSEAQGESAVDYGFHMTLCAGDRATLDQVPEVVRAGMPSFKLYTTYAGFRLTDDELLAAFQAIAKAGGLALVHAESDAVIQNASARLRAAGRLAVSDFPESRPAAAEEEAVERVLSLASCAGAKVYIVHVSTRGAAEAVARARRDGQPAAGETCPQYLLLDETRYQEVGPGGAKYVCCPPLRSQDDQAALWEALRDGGLQTIGTDHCAFNFRGQKDAGAGSFPDIPSGLPGIELRLALIYTYGVQAGKISISRWIDLCCTAPARLFGLHPRKGELLPGADADIVLFDPRRTTTISSAELHEAVDYTPYEGLTLAGTVRTTILRGKVLVCEGVWAGAAPAGEFIAC
ncbi:MAG TPA: dihydropyrimidinase, partial [Anaerolineaceae bacterium]